jgi:hypothetical protein
MTSARGIVLFGDVAASRRDSTRASRWLRLLAAELDRRYAADRLARFGFTQGDELQGLLGLESDPLEGILWACLQPDALSMLVGVGGRGRPGSWPRHAADW